ncbi:MAG: 16S rRNA (cytidine(1402)-2'-O)-methyltransferase [Acidimicrobiia bacterium]
MSKQRPQPTRRAPQAHSGGGQLVLVATPIGNLGDLSPRAIEALRSADVIGCEDTRRLATLLSHAGITRPEIVLVNEHTEHEAAAAIASLVAQGHTVALTSDAGMPAISDPGERVVRAVLDNGGHVTAVPGPSSLTMALAVSGLPTARFVMEGFLPRSGSVRPQRLAALAREERTIVLFEAPHRLARTLADLSGALGGQRRIAISRELTKLHEECWRGTLAEACVDATAREPRGEYVLVIDGGQAQAPPDETAIDRALEAARERGLSRKDSVTEVSTLLGVAKNLVYERSLHLPERSS